MSKYLFSRVLLVVFCACAAVSANEDLKVPADIGIIGGTPVQPGEITYVTSVDHVNKSRHCGGVIINEKWILTAATCTTDEPSMYHVLAGSIDLHSSSLVQHKVVEIRSHEKYERIGSSNPPVHDIALMKVEPPFEWGSLVSLVALPKQWTETPEGSAAIISGWDRTKPDMTMPSLLMKIEVPVVSKARCHLVYKEKGGPGIQQNQMCAGLDEGGKDACAANAGSPLVSGGELRGLVSWGRGCARPGIPGVYTEVSAYRDWIDNIVSK